ncbi:MAG: bifunctional adenosylcobinamide kinase/adenosylcobinamide-phosphate guanylyltransferase [Atopobiaceae bacterium]|nr:bifunctional adenosylcobinamide kinase/adenosylcobinamide-phosphate guanylyltransferase [Atopobiaceae bacterium]MBR3315631.1 bifunctional adenosylcobinamide kinase/adenosylcobinamide-phosphate guanylyltransferase [Atopobiaceae bacterium]
MMFVTGPAFAGKRTFVRQAMGWDEEELARHAVWDAQNVPPHADLARLADELATHDVVIACEVGGGVVPLDAAQRAQREDAGRLACLLAERADCVVRICCGLPQVLKGELA